MIQPTEQDVGREVSFTSGAGTATGMLKRFGPHYCYVEVAGVEAPIRREALEWAGEPLPAKESPRAAVARSHLQAAGFTVDTADSAVWLIEGFSFWPEGGMWKHPDGSLGGNGLTGLIAALRAARPSVSHETLGCRHKPLQSR